MPEDEIQKLLDEKYSEAAIQLMYIAFGGILSICLMVIGIVLVYTTDVPTQDERILTVASILAGLIGMIAVVGAAIIVLCRAYNGVYARNIAANIRKG